MKKRYMVFYFITLMAFCQYLPVGAISEGQKSAIVDHCEAIKADLRTVQRSDSRTRVYLGGYYESILTKYMMPLNVKLVEANLPNVGLVENQNSFAATRGKFAEDFVNYQKGLEELVAMNCKAEPENFYEKLTSVRKKRKVVEQDVVKIRELTAEQVKMVKKLAEEL